MNHLQQTVCFTAFVLALSINVASAERDDMGIIDPNGDWGENDLMPLPPGFKTSFDNLTPIHEDCESDCVEDGETDDAGLFIGNFVVTNESSSEICWMTMLPLVGDNEIPQEFSVGDMSSCLRSGDVVQVDYTLYSVACDVYIEFLDKRNEVIASAELDHCVNTYMTIE